MGLLGSKEERECKKARRKCERNQKKCERQERRRERKECRRNRCRRTPYICVEDECCDDACLGNFVQVNNFERTPKFRMYNPVCRPCSPCSPCPPCGPPTCGPPCLPSCGSPCGPPCLPSCGSPCDPCLPSCGSPCDPCLPLCGPSCDPCLSPFSKFGFGDCFNGFGCSDPVNDFNCLIASFPPGTDFSNLLSAFPNLMNNDAGIDFSMFNALNGSQQALDGQECLAPPQPQIQPPCPPPPPPPCPPQPSPPPCPPALPPTAPPGEYTITSSNPNLNIPTAQGPISILVKNQLPPVPITTTSQQLAIPPLPPVPHDVIYSKRPTTTRRKYAYDDYDWDYYSRRSRSRPVEFYDDYGIDHYLHDRHSSRYRDYYYDD